MTAFKVTVEVGGRSIESVVRRGILATVEVGTHTEKVETPSHKIVILSDKADDGPTAWIQISSYTDSRAEITYEGWIKGGSATLRHSYDGSAVTAFISEERSASQEVLDAHIDLVPGSMRCCISYGSGCYVKCCNGCCSDPVGCPGASCCG